MKIIVIFFFALHDLLAENSLSPLYAKLSNKKETPEILKIYKLDTNKSAHKTYINKAPVGLKTKENNIFYFTYILLEKIYGEH